MREATIESTVFDQELNLLQALAEQIMSSDDHEVNDTFLNDFYLTIEQLLDRLSDQTYRLLLSSCDNKKEVIEIARERTLEANNSYEGRKTNDFPENFPRPYRSFRGDREIQLLRHVATQLYFALKTNIPKDLIKNLKEIQVMHLAVAVNIIFILQQMSSVSHHIYLIFIILNLFKSILTCKLFTF